MKRFRKNYFAVETLEPLIVLSASPLCDGSELVVPGAAEPYAAEAPHPNSPIDKPDCHDVVQLPTCETKGGITGVTDKFRSVSQDGGKLQQPVSNLVINPVINIQGDGNHVSIFVDTSIDPEGKQPQLPGDSPDKGDPGDSIDTYREIDGTDNNLKFPAQGSAGSELVRMVEADYGDGKNSMAGADRPNPREISNLVNDQDFSIPNGKGISDFLWAWGQFIDHDMDLTKAESGEQAPIKIPTGDPHFDPMATGDQVMPFERSSYVVDEDGVRQHINEITAYLDASMVYGSDAETEELLRSHEAGKLLMPDNMLQMGTGEDGRPGFISGDVRAGENIMLTSLHTLFSREHNRIADEIASHDYAYADLANDAVDEEIFQRTRAIVGAQIQKITYEEFLPALLGDGAIEPYRGYDQSVDASVATEFSTAAFRVGHTMISSEIQRLDPYGNEVAVGNVELRDAFFNPEKLIESGIDPILQGGAAQESQKIDVHIIDDLRNFLFGGPGSGGMDLASLNIQRGRDHGLASFNDTREALGLEAVTSFEEISSDPEVAHKLKSAYGHVDNIDLWVGGLAEDHIGGGSVGETFRTIIADQFERLRDGDRYWYEKALPAEDYHYVYSTSLGEIINQNTTAKVQSNVFYV